MKEASGMAVAAARKMLANKGYKTLDEIERGGSWLVARHDEGFVAFVRVLEVDEMHETNPKSARGLYENVAGEWLILNGETLGEACSVRFDEIQVRLLSSKQAFLRHHLNVLNGGDD